MHQDPVRELLKASPKRSVHLESDERPGQPERRIVKRFHGPDLLDRVRDRLRARNEHELLGLLHALGLPVPRAYEHRHRNGAWEVVTEYVENALPLDAWLRSQGDESRAQGDKSHAQGDESRAQGDESRNQRAGSPPELARLARELGRLVARLMAAGLDHRDLHPGNFLVESRPTGAHRIWLIDLSKSRLRAKLSGKCMLRDLVQLAAGLRELVDQGMRRRFLVEFLGHLPEELRAELPPRAELGRVVEDAARLFRRRDIARRTRRWLRESSSVEPYDDAQGRGFVNRTVPRSFADEVQRALTSGRWMRHGLFEAQGRTALIVRAQTWSALTEVWSRQVRLFTHGVPSLTPLCISRTPDLWLALEVGRTRTTLERETADPRSPERRALVLRSFGALMGTLHDRLLDVHHLTPDSLWIDQDQRLCFGPLPELVERSAAAATGAAERCALLEPWSGPCSEGDHALYTSAYMDALRPSEFERRPLLAGTEE